MDEDDPPSEHAHIAGQTHKAKALKQFEDAVSNGAGGDSAESTQKCNEVRFKVAHGLLLVFFFWLL